MLSSAEAVRMTGLRERGRIAAIALPTVVVAATGLGFAFAPSWDWPTAPISAIGAGDGSVALAFNVLLVVAGVTGLPYARVLWTQYHRAVGLLTGVVAVGFVGAGLFPVPQDLHAVFGGWPSSG